MKGLRGDHPKRIARTDTHPPNEDFNISLMTCNGEVTSLAWPQVANIKNLRYTSCRYYQPYQVLKISQHSLKNCGSDTGQNLFGGYVTWSDLVTWPDMTPTKKITTHVKFINEKPCQISLRWPSWFSSYSRRTTGGSNWPPPGRRLTRALMGSGELHVLMGGGPKGPPPYLQK